MADGVKWFARKDTRPLSVVNTDNRIIANVFREVLKRFADKNCRPEQRGFLNNRFLLENVVDIDFESRQVYLEDINGGLLLVDLAAAFPSLGPEYLFKVFEKQGIPDTFIQTIRTFYVGNLHFTNLDGISTPSFTVKSGVRQGCTMSRIFSLLR